MHDDDNEQLIESCLELIQQMSAEGAINDEQRDSLKGKCRADCDVLEMVFDEDTTLLSFFERYREPE